MIHIFTCSWYWCWKILFLWGFYVELKSLIKNFQLFSFHEHFRKLPFADVLQNNCTEKLRDILNYKESPTLVFSREYCKFFKNSFLRELLRWLLLHFFKSNQKVFLTPRTTDPPTTHNLPTGHLPTYLKQKTEDQNLTCFACIL